MGIICFFGTTITENYRITLYTTHGVFEKVTRNRRDFTFFLELNEASSLEVNIGIGIGITAEVLLTMQKLPWNLPPKDTNEEDVVF
jgi:hypothetical protein